MNKLNTQKFMNLFNNMLIDRNGSNEPMKKLEAEIAPIKGDDVDIVTAQKSVQLSQRLDQRNILFLKNFVIFLDNCCFRFHDHLHFLSKNL